MGDFGGGDVTAIGPFEGPISGHGSQQSGPLRLIQRRAHIRQGRQQYVVFHIQQTCRVVPTLDRHTKADKAISIVSKLGSIDCATDQTDRVQCPFCQICQRQFGSFGPLEILQFLKAAVDRVPCVTGQCRPHNAGVFPRRTEAGQDRGRVVRIKEQEGCDIPLDQFAELLNEIVIDAQRPKHRVPVIPEATGDVGQQSIARAHFQQACGCFGTLDIAAHPVKVISCTA